METKKQFFQIGHAQSQTRGFAWAMGFGPLDGPMPFFSPSRLQQKREFWKVNPRKPGLYIDDDGKANAWPDILGHGGGCPRFFVSDKVVGSLVRERIEIARLTAMPIAEVLCSALEGKPSPGYFVLEAPYAIDVDYTASGVPIDAEGRPVRLLKSPIWKLKLSSWTGRDLFGWPNIWKGPDWSLICTERVVELAKRDGWTNCRFDPISAV
jgi:hypothetical protein